MKKRLLFFTLIVIISILLYFNKVIEIEYNKNIFQYYTLSKALTIEEIKMLKENEPLIYAGNIMEPPLGIYYEESDQYLGLVVDYINALSIELGITILLKPMIWDEALEALANRESDLCDMIPSEERAKTFGFSDPLYFLKGIAVVQKENKTVYNLKDLERTVIVVQKGDIVIELIKSMGIDASFMYVDNISEALTLLNEGVVDAVAGDEPVIKYYIEKDISNIAKYRILEELIYEEACVLAVPIEKKELLNVINKAIFNLNKNGVINQIEKKWREVSSSIVRDKSNEKLKLGFIIIIPVFIIGIYLTYIWNRSLKTMVNFKTRELELIKDELQITFDGMENFLVVIDMDGKISNMNTAFLCYLNIKIGDAINKDFEKIEILKKANLENDNIFHNKIKFIEEPIKNNLVNKYEFQYNDSMFEIIVHQLVEKDKMPRKILVMFIDKTLEKLEAQRMIHSNKMEAVGQLASGIAHELRNPLGVIRNSTYILNEELDKEDTLKLKVLNAINNSVNRASTIIENLLKFSRLSNDELEVFNVYEVILEITQYFNKQFEENNINVKIDCNKNLEVISNPQSFRHITINLISNAVDAMPEGGTIDIRCQSSQKEITLIISDSGVGILDNVKDKIFNPFYTTKPAGKGTGLGLFIVYAELQKINGTIKFESNAGKGTTFIISILRRENYNE